MAFPHISTKTSNYTIMPELEEIIEEKFTSLERFMDVKGDEWCEVELEKIGNHNTGKIFRAEINLYSGGKLFRAEATEEQMEQSIDKIRNEMRHELQKALGKRHSLVKRGHQMFKNLLRFGRE